MRVQTWVVAAVGAAAVGLLGAVASAGGDGGPVRGAQAQAAPAVTGVADVRLEQLGGDPCARPGTPLRSRPEESLDDLLLRLTDELAYVESVFAKATPGSAGQFRAREESDSLRERLRSIRCGHAAGNAPR